MTIDTLLARLHDAPDSIEFAEVIAAIDRHYRYTPAAFHNGLGTDAVFNPAGTNEGSCRVFAFAQLHGLDRDRTLACFGEHYRQAVLQHPDGSDHTNIRTFMRHGPAGIRFEGPALRPRG